MPVSRLDIFYRKMLLTKFFTKGWGSPEGILKLFKFRKVVSNRQECFKLVPDDYEIDIMNIQDRSGFKIIDGKFYTPMKLYLPDLLVPEVQQVFFQMIIPQKWPCQKYRPMIIQLAGTGDHYFWRRRNLMAIPLLQSGIGSIILENPYYGLRKPSNQTRSSLHFVSDIFVMGGCLILECIALLKWCEKMGFAPLGVSGISMGGHMASLAAASWPKPIVLVPCLSWSTASSVFTEGVMSESIDWDMLQKQFLANKVFCDTLSKTCKIVDSPFSCSLSRIPEYGLDEFWETEAAYISPYELIHLLDTRNCPAISYKLTSSQEKMKPPIDFEVFRESALFKSSQKLINMRKRDKEALWFMRGMMDEFTHLKNFAVPYDPSLIIGVCAKADGYVPRVGVSNLEELWPGAVVKYIDTGHVGAYIWYRKMFRESIVEAIERAKNVVPPPNFHTDF